MSFNILLLFSIFGVYNVKHLCSAQVYHWSHMIVWSEESQVIEVRNSLAEGMLDIIKKFKTSFLHKYIFIPPPHTLYPLKIISSVYTVRFISAGAHASIPYSILYK